MGLAAEMFLKAAYFRFIGYAAQQPLGHDDLAGARSDANHLGVAEPHDSYHNLLFWTELIVTARAAGLPARTRRTGSSAPSVHPHALFPADVLLLRRAAGRLAENWSISDRYLDVQAYATRQDLDDVFEDVITIDDLYDASRM